MLLDATEDVIDGRAYPVTTDELIEDVGDRELDVPNGSETVGEALARLGTETFETPEEARFAIYTGVSNRAIGRRWYSDRDPTPPGSPYGPDAVSF